MLITKAAASHALGPAWLAIRPCSLANQCLIQLHILAEPLDFAGRDNPFAAVYQSGYLERLNFPLFNPAPDGGITNISGLNHLANAEVMAFFSHGLYTLL